VVDRQRRVWIGRKDGVDCWADGKLREWSSHNGSIAGPVRALAEDSQGVIWAGADTGSLYRFEGDGFRAFPLPDFPAHRAVWSLLPDADGSLWLGTLESGLLHFEAGKFTRFTSEDGLPEGMICQILDDQRGNLWLGTHYGICRVSKAALRDFASGKTSTIACSVYDRSDGLPTLQCSDMYQPAAWRGHDGKLWFATAKGVVGVQPDEMPVNSRPPPVAMEEFLVDGKIQPQTEELDASTSTLKVQPGKRNFEFHYTALSLVNADKIQFRYKLEGFDSGWTDAGSRRWVQYNYLKPGNYRFRVAACNNDGVWNETGASINLQILPHVWETPAISVTGNCASN
jgi:ligand-binding sensor domain-containing protein